LWLAIFANRVEDYAILAIGQCRDINNTHYLHEVLKNIVVMIEMNTTGTLPSEKLPIFFLSGGQITRVYVMID
jgi:hypothetical protein